MFIGYFVLVFSRTGRLDVLEVLLWVRAEARAQNRPRGHSRALKIELRVAGRPPRRRLWDDRALLLIRDRVARQHINQHVSELLLVHVYAHPVDLETLAEERPDQLLVLARRQRLRLQVYFNFQGLDGHSRCGKLTYFGVCVRENN